MPSEGDQTIRPERVAIVTVTSGSSNQLTAQLLQPAFQLPAIPRGEPSRHSGREDKLLAESRRDRPARLHQRLQMRFGRFLKTKHRFTAFFPMGMTTGQEAGLGNPHAILIPP